MNQVLTLAGNQYTLSGDRLRISHRGDTVFDVCLSPILDGRPIPMGPWEKTGPSSFSASLGEYGRAFVGEKFDKLAYWIETPVRQFENVTYLSDGIISGEVWRTFVSDEYERVWEKKLDRNIPLSSAYAVSYSPDTDDPSGGITDPGDCPVHWIWNVHVRAWAMKGREKWLGISIPGPWGIGIARLNMHKTRFSLRFENIQARCTDGKMPVVYFCPGLADGFDILDEHRNLSEKLGLFNLEIKKIPDWWNDPSFYYYDEMERQIHQGTIKANSQNVIDLVREWLGKIQERINHRGFIVPLEQGCYRMYGDYRPAEIMGTTEQVRAVIDAWRKEGVHVGFYIHPFIVNTKIKFYQEHPEAFCKPKDPNFLMDYPLETWDSDNPKFAPLDWTHPLGREFLLKQVEYLLSDAPGCLNCDILRSNHWRSPDPRYYTFHDPDWGIGDMMTYKVQKLLYEKAKGIKPDCLVTKVAALDCYMQPWFDAMQIAEDWTHNMQHWYRRSQLATHVLKNTLVWIDAWFLTRTKGDEYNMGMLAWSRPETDTWLEHAPHCYYPSWRKLEEKRFRRQKAGYHVYLNSPPHPSDECRLTWNYEKLEIYRRKTTGPLAGWYGGLALSPRCFVTYNENQALVTASENRLDFIPLPPQAHYVGVTKVLHTGHEINCEHTFDPATNSVYLYIEDCGKDVFYYRVKYTLRTV